MTKKNAIERYGFNPDTVFEEILSGTLPADFVYKDKLVSAFMDIQPITEGHVLVIPNEKVESLDMLKPRVGERMFVVAQNIALAIKKSNLNSEGINFFLADGRSAGQTVFHLHLHVFPRYLDDGFGWQLPNRYHSPPDRETIRRNCEKIKSKLN